MGAETTAATYLLGASTGLTVLGTVQNWQSQKATMASQRKQAKANEVLAEDAAIRPAEAEKRETEQRADQARKEQRRLRGQQITAWGQSGGGLEGSALHIIGSSTYQDEDDVQVLLRGSAAKRRNMIRSGYRYGGNVGSVQSPWAGLASDTLMMAGMMQ